MSFTRAALLVVLAAIGCGGSRPRAGAWINRTVGTAAARLSWTGIASDATGAQLVAITGGDGQPSAEVWTSGDAGATWTDRMAVGPGQGWRSVTSDATGTHLWAVTAFTGTTPGGEDVWGSADRGATWAKQTTVTSTAPLVVGPTLVADASGTRLVLADGDIWTSGDAGATWVDATAGTSAAAQSWVDLAADATAAHLVAATDYGDIWTSADGGATWTNRTAGTSASRQPWQAVASDATGTRLVAVCQQSGTKDGVLSGGDIFTSADAGATWTNRTTGTAASGKPWVAVASGADGARLVAACAHAAANDIWTSADAGMTWTNQTAGTTAAGQQWVAVAADATGTHLAAVSSDPPGGGPCCSGDVWTN